MDDDYTHTEGADSVGIQLYLSYKVVNYIVFVHHSFPEYVHCMLGRGTIAHR